MKKILILMFSLLLLLAGCSSSGNAGDTNTKGDKKEKSEEKAETAEPKLEIVKTADGAWKDSIDTVWVHSAAVYENTGDVPVKIGEAQMNFKAQDDSILGTSSMVYAVPDVVQPGETAFIGETNTLEGTADPAEFKETTYNFSFDETDDKGNLMEISGEKGIKGDEWTPYKVTGVVKNTSEELQDDIRIAAGLFDDQGNLLGVLTGSVDVGLNAGSEAGFELSYPEVPMDIVDKITKIEVKAYGWTW